MCGEIGFCFNWIEFLNLVRLVFSHLFQLNLQVPHLVMREANPLIIPTFKLSAILKKFFVFLILILRSNDIKT